MESMIFKGALGIHVLCGILSLFSGLVAMIAKKGSKIHNKSGLVFYWSMFMIFITTVLFFIIYPSNLKYQFFLGIGIVSFYPNWSGKRMLTMKKGIKPELIDKIGAVLIGVSGIIMIAYGAYLVFTSTQKFEVLSILFFVFGTVSLMNSYGDLRLYLGYVKAAKMHWFFAHGGKMIGAYSAAMTAFCVNIVPKYLPEGLPDYVYLMTWILPGVLIGIIGNRMIKKFRIKFSS